MLKQLSRLKRTRKYLIFAFAVVMAISLVIFYAPNRAARVVDPAKSTEVIAEVGSDDITVADLAFSKEIFLQRFGGSFSISQLGGYGRLLDAAVLSRVLVQEAERLGLAASDAEVADRIRRNYTVAGEFVGLERYKDSIISRFGDLERFEQSMRDEIAQEKLRVFVTASVRVTDEEVQDKYKRDNAEFDLSYIIVSAAKIAEKIQPTDDELRSYYEQHKAEYKYNEPQKKIRYLYINTEKIGEKLQVPDSELRQRYDGLAPEHKQAGVKVQQILLKVARKDLDQTVEEKANSLVAKAKAASQEKGEEVFADLARGNSEDPATAKNGGWLSRVVKKNPNKADPLYDRTVDMQPGEVTEPVKHGGHWYILRRGESVPKTFEQAKPELLVSARNSQAFSVASQLAARAQARLKETSDPQKVAQELAAEANMRPADMVKETPFILPGDDVANIGANQQFEQAIEPLNNPNDVGAQTGVKGGFAVPMLVEKKEPRIPEFDEVKSKVSDALKQERAREQLEARAKELAATVTSAGQLKATGEKFGLEAATQEDFKLGQTLGAAGTNPTLDEAIYQLKAGEVTKSPIKSGDNLVIVGVTDRKEADLAEFAKKREELTTSMLSERQGRVFGDYVTAVQEKMKREGKIKIYKDIVANLDASEPAPEARPQQFSFPTN